MGSVTPPASSVTIAVLTFRRPDDLDQVLPALIEQARAVSDLAAVRVLVVDNAPDASARAAVAARATLTTDIPVVYVSETTPGIAAGRNRALAESAESGLLVFIDDDERPSPGWLRSLLETRHASGAEAVVGPVVSEFAHTPDPWITAGEFFVRRRLPTGTSVDVAATNNLLLDLAFVRRHSLAFDAGLGSFGGEDTLFTRQIVALGGTILWCSEAQVTDVVPPSRLTRRWVILRAFSSGNGWSLTSLLLTSGVRRRAVLRCVLTAKGAVRIAGGVARLVVGVASASMRERAKGVRTIARGAGMISGAVGYAYQEYARP